VDITKVLPRFKFSQVEEKEEKVVAKKSEVKQEKIVSTEDERIIAGLGERQKLVYLTLSTYNGGNGSTAKELSVYLYRMGQVATPERNSVHPRLKELFERGLVKVVGKKTCEFTNRKVSIYAVRDRGGKV